MLYSPDNKTIAYFGYQQNIEIIDCKNWQPIYTFSEGNDRCKDISYSPDAKFLAGAFYETLEVYDILTMEKFLTIHNSHRPERLCYSPDGKKIVCYGRDNTLHIYNGSDGKCLEMLDMVLDFCWDNAFFIITKSFETEIRDNNGQVLTCLPYSLCRPQALKNGKIAGYIDNSIYIASINRRKTQ